MAVDAQGEQLRADILNAAAKLFGEYGYRSVGVDVIAREAEVAKRTLYRYFASKDELVLEYLGIEAARILTWLQKSTENAKTPLEKLKAFFFALAERTGSPYCRGCPFQMALGEYPDPDHAVNRLARRHKETIRTELEKWSVAAGFRDIVGTAHRLYLLMEGAWAYARLHGASPAQVPVEHRGAALNHAVILLLNGGLYAETLTAASRPAFRYRPYRPEDDEEEPVEPETLSLFGSAPPLSGTDLSPPSTTKSD